MSAAKTCTICGTDVSQQKRVKDPKSLLYYCHACWAQRAKAANVEPKNQTPSANAVQRRRHAPALIVVGISILIVVVGAAVMHFAGESSESTESSATDSTRSLQPITGGPHAGAVLTAYGDGGVFNLLAAADLARDAVVGTWTHVSEGVECLDGKPRQRVRLHFVNMPDGEYDFGITFTPQGNASSVAQILSYQRKMFAWIMGSANMGFAMVDNKSNTQNSSTRKIGLVGGTEYRSIVKVRHDGVSAYLNGRLVSELKTDYSNLKLNKIWDLGSPGLGVAAECPIQLQAAEVTPFQGGTPATTQSEQEIADDSAAVDRAPMPVADSVREETADCIITGSGFQLAGIDDGMKAFSNRNYVWQGVPQQFRGWQYTQTRGGVRAAITVQAKRDVSLFATAAAGQKGLDPTGWTRVEDLSFTYSDRGQTRMDIYQRRLAAGDKITVVQGSWSGMILLVPLIPTDEKDLPATRGSEHSPSGNSGAIHAENRSGN